MANRNPCFGCGFWESDYEACTCPSGEMWYACPIESEKPENQEELRKYAEWLDAREKEAKHD